MKAFNCNFFIVSKTPFTLYLSGNFLNIHGCKQLPSWLIRELVAKFCFSYIRVRASPILFRFN